MAPLLLDNTLRAGGSGVSSVSAFTGDDCSAPEEQSVSTCFCGVVKGKLRKEKGGFVEGVDGGGKINDPDGPTDDTEGFGGESRKLAGPGNCCASISFHFSVPEKSCTYASDQRSLYSDCYLRRPLETVNLYLLDHGLLAIASP